MLDTLWCKHPVSWQRGMPKNSISKPFEWKALQNNATTSICICKGFDFYIFQMFPKLAIDTKFLVYDTDNLLYLVPLTYPEIHGKMCGGHLSGKIAVGHSYVFGQL